MSYKLPRNLSRRDVVEVDIAPSAEVKRRLQLWPSGSRLEAHFYPRPAQKLQEVSSGTLEQLPSRIEAHIKTKAAQSAISLTVKAGTDIFRSSPQLHQKHRVSLKIQHCPATEAEATIKNIGAERLKGVLVIRSVDLESEIAWLRDYRDNQLKKSVEEFPDPGLLLTYMHTMERHINGYPGGTSDFEEAFANGIRQCSVKKETLERLTHRLSPFRAKLLRTPLGAQLSEQSLQRGISYEKLTPIISRLAREESPTRRQYSRRSNVENKYRIWVVGLKSHQCADDVGWEYGCDREQPFVVWAASSPNFMRSGATEQGSIAQGEEVFYQKQTNVMSESLDSPAPIKPATPLIFLYQVIEKDDDSPTMDDLKETLSSALSSGVALFKGDYEKAGKEGINALTKLADLLMRAAGGGDDLYPIMGAFFNEDILLSATSGTEVGPLDKPMFESEGNYDHVSIRIPKILDTGGSLRWSMLYMISREEGPSEAKPELQSKGVHIHSDGSILLTTCNLERSSTLVKVRGMGSTGQNMLAIREEGDTITGASGYDCWLGTQQFQAQVKALRCINGVTLLGLSNGRLLKMQESGGTGQNMFAITESEMGFESVPGYSFLLGSQRFGAGVEGLWQVNDVLFIALANGTLVKVQGTGGTGTNMLAIREEDSKITGLPDYNYWLGTQQF